MISLIFLIKFELFEIFVKQKKSKKIHMYSKKSINPFKTIKILPHYL